VKKIKLLRDTGLFDDSPLAIGDVHVRPIDVAAKLLFKHWRYNKGDKDVALLRVVAEGTRNGAKIQKVIELVDRFDPARSISAMARTTGYTACAAARLLANGEMREFGIIPPEFLVRSEKYSNFIYDYLRKRGVHWADIGKKLL
jgi:saccharopine dehydrogenase-like NADP-dependent oxidoreductase